MGGASRNAIGSDGAEIMPPVADIAPETTAWNLVVRVARASLVYGSANLGLKAAGLVLVLVYTRFLTPSDYGVVSLAESIAMVPGFIWGLGITAALRRLYFEHLDRPGVLLAYVGTVLRSTNVAIVLGLLLSIVFLPWLLFRAHFAVAFYPYVLLALGAAACNSLTDFRLALYQTEQQPREHTVLSAVIFGAIGCATLVFVVIARGGATGLLAGKLIGSAIGAVASLFLLRKWLPGRWELRHLRETLSLSLPLVPHQLMAMILLIADRFILQRYVSLSQIGIYSLAYALGMVMYLVSLSLGQAWSPLFFDTARSGESGRTLLGQFTSGMLLFLIGVACLGALLAQPFVHWLLDPRYQAAGRIIPLVIAAYFLHAVFGVSHHAALQGKSTWAITYASGMAAFTNIALNLWWAARWGIYGAAYATVVGYAIEAGLMYLIAQRIYWLGYDLRSIGFAALLFVGVVVLTQLRGDVQAALVGLLITLPALYFIMRNSARRMTAAGSLRH